MALTVVLVVGAALLIRTFMNLESVNPGFAMHNVISMTMSISGDRFQKSAPVAQVIDEGTNRLLAEPGILDAGVSNCLPMVGGFGMGFDVVGRPKGGERSSGGAGFCSISYGYVSTLKIPLLRGRNFTRQDDASSRGVAIINEAMARQYWPNGDPLKDRILIGAGAGPAFAEGPREIVGIIGDTHDRGPDSDPAPMMYIPSCRCPTWRQHSIQRSLPSIGLCAARWTRVRWSLPSTQRCDRPAEASQWHTSAPWRSSSPQTSRASD
jgi:hypothetical protein